MPALETLQASSLGQLFTLALETSTKGKLFILVLRLSLWASIFG